MLSPKNNVSKVCLCCGGVECSYHNAVDTVALIKTILKKVLKGADLQKDRKKHNIPVSEFFCNIYKEGSETKLLTGNKSVIVMHYKFFCKDKGTGPKSSQEHYIFSVRFCLFYIWS